MNDAKHVVVSGGSRGLGEHLVTSLLVHGYRVSTFSRKRTPFVRQVESGDARDRFCFAEADITNGHALEGFVKEASACLGVPWGLVNNAGLAIDRLHVLATDHEMQEMLTVNLLGTLRLTRQCARAMLPQRRGRIVTIGSIVGRRGFRGLVTYSATKAALEGMTRALARELGEAGITVNAVAPGYLETAMSAALGEAQRAQVVNRTPLGRLGAADDVAPAVLFLLSDGARFITGHTLVVDGGASC